MERTLLKTDEFVASLASIASHQSRTRIVAKVHHLAFGLGDVKPVGEGVSELRLDFGPGYRVYFKNHGRQVVILLLCGDKSSQRKDIGTAKQLARKIKKEVVEALLCRQDQKRLKRP